MSRQLAIFMVKPTVRILNLRLPLYRLKAMLHNCAFRTWVSTAHVETNWEISSILIPDPMCQEKILHSIMRAARPATPARPRAPTVAIGMAAPVALDAAEEALPAAALVALARRDVAEPATDDADASAEEAPALADDAAEEAPPESELATDEAEALAPDAAEEARLETLDAPEEAEPYAQLVTDRSPRTVRLLTPTPPTPKMVL